MVLWYYHTPNESVVGITPRGVSQMTSQVFEVSGATQIWKMFNSEVSWSQFFFWRTPIFCRTFKFDAFFVRFKLFLQLLAKRGEGMYASLSEARHRDATWQGLLYKSCIQKEDNSLLTNRTQNFRLGYFATIVIKAKCQQNAPENKGVGKLWVYNMYHTVGFWPFLVSYVINLV